MLTAAVIVSALLHASWNAMLRGHPDRRAGGVAVLFVCGVTAAIAAAVDVVARGVAPFPGGDGLAASVIAGLFEAGYFAALTRGLAAGALGPVYTISRGGAIVLVWPISALAFAEPLSPLGLAGTGVLLGGLALAGLERTVPRAVAGWALLAAACIAGYHLVYKVALAGGAAPPAVFATGIAIAVPIQAALLRVSPRAATDALRAAPLRTLIAGTLATASFLLFLLALQSGGAGVVLTLRNTSVVFALLLAATIGDRPTPRQLLGALLVTTGATLVGLA